MYRENGMKTWKWEEVGLKSLVGKWEKDNCPFEFDYVESYQYNQYDLTDGQIKSIDGDQYALVQECWEQAIITIYSDNEQIKQIVVEQMDYQWNFDQMSFNSEYLCLISHCEKKLYYHNFNYNQYKYQIFDNDDFTLSFQFQQNQLDVVVCKLQKYLQLYRIDQQFELQLLKQINLVHDPQEQEINGYHRLGFFYRNFQQNCFRSNQTLKLICIQQWADQVLNLKDLGAITQQQDCFIFLDQDYRTLMTQISNGKLIRRIKQVIDVSTWYEKYEKQLFRHFLIICSQVEKHINVCDIYDSIKGRYVATIYYRGGKGLYSVKIQNNQLIIPTDYGYKIKEIYQK